MIIKEFKFYPFDIELKEPLVNSEFQINSRKGFIIKITDDSGNLGFGEVSPLPGFSNESLNECEVALNKLYYSIIEKGGKGETFDLGLELSAIRNLPSLLFGFEQAIISLLFLRGEMGNSFDGEKNIQVNGLVGITDETKLFKRIDDLLISGIKTIKIKIGKKSVQEDVELINRISERIDDSIKLRLDVNGKWSYKDAEYAFDNLNKNRIEYIEQPVSDINEIVMLSDFSPIPIAVDELVKNMDDAFALIEKSNVQILVIKPSILGSIIRAITLIKTAEKLKKKIVVSSAFETAVGRSALIFLAALTGGNYAHGLGTASFLKNDLIKEPFPVENGFIKYSSDKYPPDFEGINL